MCTAAVPPLHVDDTVAALGGSTIVFVGDSVLRQLSHAAMCRLARRLRHDGTVWRNPMKRRHPSFDYEGVCPFDGGRHCEHESGCATFGLPRGGEAGGGGGGARGSTVPSPPLRRARPLS